MDEETVELLGMAGKVLFFLIAMSAALVTLPTMPAISVFPWLTVILLQLIALTSAVGILVSVEEYDIDPLDVMLAVSAETVLLLWNTSPPEAWSRNLAITAIVLAAIIYRFCLKWEK